MKQPGYAIVIIIFLLLWIFIAYHQRMDKQINISRGKYHQIRALIISSPIFKKHHLSFIVKLHCLDRHKASGNVKISWYGTRKAVYRNDIWQLKVHLLSSKKVPAYHTFDYGKWLAIHNIQAVGYVKNANINQLLHRNHHSFKNLIFRSRKKLAYEIYHCLKNTKFKFMAGLLSALTVGLKTHVSQAQWQIFRNTGTSHLMAISGLHIGLCAFFSFYLAVFLWCRSEFLILLLPAQKAGLIVSWVCSALYTLFSGFALPSQRAFIMISLIIMAKLVGRHISLARSLSQAFVIILLFEPLAFISASFWLSFFAVFLIVFSLSGRLNPYMNLWWKHFRLQWLITLGLMPLTLWFFQKTSLIAIVANMIAIPMVTFAIAPLALVGCVISLFSHFVSCWLFYIAAILLKILMLYLSFLQKLPDSVWHFQLQDMSQLLALSTGILLIMLPKGIPIRFMGIFLIIATFI